MERWKVYAKKADFNALAAKYNIDPVITRIIRNRDVVTDSDYEMYLSDDMSKLHNPWLLKDMNKAIDIVKAKISEGKRIRIIGDYDIDGICSICILINSLADVGANADYVVPHRITDGYGINENLIQEAYEAGVDTIITCDNGIAAIEQIAYGKSLGMTIVVTDHHEIPFIENNGQRETLLPKADAIINPKQGDCEYPFKGICGAMVAYKFAQCLYQVYSMPEAIRRLDEFAAIATIGDIMELKDENRIIVKCGLKKLSKTDNIGLKALINAAGVNCENVTSYDVGFRIGPCLNASGRLDTAKDAVDLLMSKSEYEAGILANTLVSMNEERKLMTENGKHQAEEMVENGELVNDKVLVIYLPECHESIAGIIAGRIKEKYNKPTIVLTNAENGVKGSGRSIEGYDMFEELTKCKDLFIKFGGHKMAAGVSLQEENVDVLRRRLNENCDLKEDDFVKTVWIDVPMPIGYISEKLIDELTILEPFGNGNCKPVFADRELYVKSLNIIGKNKNVVKMSLVDVNGYFMEALYFGEVEEFARDIKVGTKHSFTYYPSVNEFRGERTLQIIVTGYQ